MSDETLVWRFKLTFPDGTVETEDEVYETEEEAYAAAEQWISDYHQGMEVLNMSNPGDYPLSEVASYEDIEIEVWDDYK